MKKLGNKHVIHYNQIASDLMWWPVTFVFSFLFLCCIHFPQINVMFLVLILLLQSVNKFSFQIKRNKSSWIWKKIKAKNINPWLWFIGIVQHFWLTEIANDDENNTSGSSEKIENSIHNLKKSVFAPHHSRIPSIPDELARADTSPWCMLSTRGAWGHIENLFCVSWHMAGFHKEFIAKQSL